MTTATATKFSVVLDEGVEIGRKAQTPKRRYSHALVQRAETAPQVMYRHERRQAADTDLIAALENELAGTPVARHAGAPGSGKIIIQAPVKLRPLIDAVYGSSSAQDAAVAQYLALVGEALESAQSRLAESQMILEQLAEGVYVLQPAMVLKFAGSRLIAQGYMNGIAALEPYALMGLAIVRTTEMDA